MSQQRRHFAASTDTARAAGAETSGRTLRIGEVARETGLSVETLRFYEQRGLLGRPSRTGAGYRVYDASVLEQIAFIKRAQAIGFTLDEVAQILLESADGRLPCREVRELARRKLAELDERLKELRRYRQELARTLDAWDEQQEAPGRVCGLIEGSTVNSHGAHADDWRQARRRKRR